MDELAALRYCVEVLEVRGKADPARAWLWAIKRKVAAYCVRAIEQSGSRRARSSRYRAAVAARLALRGKRPAWADDQRETGPLTEEEKQLIRETHPLLQDTRSKSLGAGLQSHCQWYIEIRQKVGAFGEAWRQHHGPSAGEGGGAM